MNNLSYRIGTRDSLLARWQADQVKTFFEHAGLSGDIVPVKSEGDLDLVTPLYEMGVEGVFTKTLDAYLLSHKVDLAVHSMKDVPTRLAKGLRMAAVLPRGNTEDLLVFRNADARKKYLDADDMNSRKALKGTIATGSIRRKAQLLHRYPGLEITDLRGNLQTRLEKLYASDWDAAVFAAAGLERLGEKPLHTLRADWMLPAPAQGAVLVVCREKDKQLQQQLQQLHHEASGICVDVERAFLTALMGGCATPIAALAQLTADRIVLRGSVTAADGKQQFLINREVALDQAGSLGKDTAEMLLKEGGDALSASLRKSGTADT